MKKLLVLLLFCSFTTVFGQSLTLPEKPNKFIVDYAGVLTPSQVEEEATMLKELYTITKAQVVVVITNDVPKDYPLDDYCQKLFTKWGIGTKGANNGVLILICPNNRKSRIQPGYGLEEYLPDGYTKIAQKKYFNPHFKQGDFHGGIVALLTDMLPRMTTKEAVATQQHEVVRQEKKESEVSTELLTDILLYGLLFGLVVALTIYVLYRKHKQQELKEFQLRQLKITEDSLVSYKQKLELIIKNKFEVEDATKALNQVTQASAALKEYANKGNLAMIEETSDTLLKALLSDIEQVLIKYQSYTETIYYQNQISDLVKKINVEIIDEYQTLANSLSQKYGDEIWNYSSTKISPIDKNIFNNLVRYHTNCITSITNSLNKVETLLNEKQYVNAKSEIVTGYKNVIELNQIYDEVKSKQKQIDEADNYIKKEMLDINKNIYAATLMMKKEGVDDSTRMRYNTLVQDIDLRYFTNSSVNVFERQIKLQDTITKIQKFYNTAKSMHDAELKRQADAETKRQNQLNIALAATQTSSYTSDSQTSNNDVDYGGGKSGGAGSDNSW